MKRETLKALKASIAHWTRLAAGNRKPGEGIGVDNCALCDLFWRPSGTTCYGCPVSERTGVALCEGTPYGDAAEIYEDENAGPDSEEFKGAARDELDFLKSLLP